MFAVVQDTESGSLIDRLFTKLRTKVYKIYQVYASMSKLILCKLL